MVNPYRLHRAIDLAVSLIFSACLGYCAWRLHPALGGPLPVLETHQAVLVAMLAGFGFAFGSMRLSGGPDNARYEQELVAPFGLAHTPSPLAPLAGMQQRQDMTQDADRTAQAAAYGPTVSPLVQKKKPVLSNEAANSILDTINELKRA
ncbi:hypothetical protein [Sphingomicrobium arenosum]|uniref:hypothetical protein n=1 Tax=Sphingomicrobium arenosum TaxID=2233861 RepID=UPI00223F0F39|nr:hypothetical protein [Sphingomicrobium arenosum]